MSPSGSLSFSKTSICIVEESSSIDTLSGVSTGVSSTGSTLMVTEPGRPAPSGSMTTKSKLTGPPSSSSFAFGSGRKDSPLNSVPESSSGPSDSKVPSAKKNEPCSGITAITVKSPVRLSGSDTAGPSLNNAWALSGSSLIVKLRTPN